MASVDDAVRFYVENRMSIPDASRVTGIPRSTIRLALKRLGQLRSRADGVRLAAVAGKLGGGLRGKTRVFTDQWISNLGASLRRRGELYSKGRSIKPSGYVEFTRGEHKGRLEHVVVMEKLTGRKLKTNEVVHHIDHNRQNNAPENLKIMDRREHASLHGKENHLNRKRNKHGQFE